MATAAVITTANSTTTSSNAMVSNADIMETLPAKSDIPTSPDIRSSCSTPQRKPRRSSLKKPGLRKTSTGDPQRHVVFGRSRSLTECETRSRSRRDSSVDTREGQGQLCRVRSFKSTSKGVVRNGESFKSMDTKTFMSTGSVRVYRKSDVIGRSDSVDSNDSSIGGSSVAESYYRVGVLGATGVGKSTLVRQFLASDEQADNNPGGNEGKSVVTVSVLLDGEESLLEFHVHPTQSGENDLGDQNLPGASPTSPEQSANDVRVMTQLTPSEDLHMDLDHCDAYAVVFGLNEYTTFQYVCRSLRLLREELGIDRAIVLVGNKADLVRQRRVSIKEACALAHKYDCKYIETSAELGHQTDELLVGTLRQIRRKLSMTSQENAFYDVKSGTKKPHGHKWQRLASICRFLHGDSRTVDSCQDFFV